MAENVVGSVKLEISSPGAEKATDGVKRFTDAAERAGIVEDKVTRIHERNERALVNIARQFDINFRKADNLARATEKIRRAEEAGLAGTREHAAARSALSKAINDNAIAFGRLETSMQKASAIAAGMSLTGGMTDPTNMARRMSASSGAQQSAQAAKLGRNTLANISAQLQDIFVMTASGASPITTAVQQGPQLLDALATSSLGLKGALKEVGSIALSVATHPFTLIATAAATAALAMSNWNTQTEALTVSLNGLGRASGLTVSQLRAIADSNAGGLSNASARGVAGALAGAGVSSGSIGGGVALAQRFSRVFGIDLEKATEQLANALAEPGKGADDLAKKYGLVTFAERQHIKELTALGDKSGATAALLKIITDRIAGLQDPTSRLTEMWDRLTSGLSNFLDAIAKANDRKTFDEVFRAPLRVQQAAREAADSVAQKRATELQRLQEDSAFAVREIQARTLAERESVAQQRAYAQTLRETNDAVKAGIAAQTERAKLEAEANRKAGDELRTAQDEAVLARLSPFERALKENEFKFRDLREQFGASAPATVAMQNVAAAGQSAAAALNNVAAAAGGYSLSGQQPGRIGGLIPLSQFQGGSRADPRGVADYIRQSAVRNGIDPNVALRVAQSEGLGTFTGDQGTSFGAFQLHVGGRRPGVLGASGLGDSFRRSTGLDPSNPMNERATIDFALQVAAREGWGPWFGAKRAGITGFQGIGGRGASALPPIDIARSANDNAATTAANDNSGQRLGTISQAENIRRATIEYSRGQKVVDEYNQSIERQRAALNSQSAAFGKSAAEVERAAAQQKLINDLEQQGVPITDALRKSIGEAADNWSRYSEEARLAAESQERVRAAMDNVRSISKEAFGGVVSDLIRGESASKALESALGRVADRIASIAVDTAIDQILGKSGTIGGASGGLGGSISGLLGGLLGGLKFADGGVMTAHGRVPLRRYAGGGVARSPQLALFGEGSTPEAFVPVPSGHIPVEFRGQNDNRKGNVTVNVIGAPPGARVEERDDPKGGRSIDVIIDERNAASLRSRQGQAAMAEYGLRPQRARRG